MRRTSGRREGERERERERERRVESCGGGWTERMRDSLKSGAATIDGEKEVTESEGEG